MKAPGGRRLAGEEALRAEKPWNWETELGERLRLVRALNAAARRVSDAEGSCQVRVYSGRGSGQVRTKTDEGREQRAGQEVSPAGVGDRVDSTTKDNER